MAAGPPVVRLKAKKKVRTWEVALSQQWQREKMNMKKRLKTKGRTNKHSWFTQARCSLPRDIRIYEGM